MSFEQTRKQQILEFLKNSLRLAFKPKEIADTLKIPRSTVRRELQSLIKPDKKTGELPKVRKFLPKDHTTRGIYSYIEEDYVRAILSLDTYFFCGSNVKDSIPYRKDPYFINVKIWTFIEKSKYNTPQFTKQVIEEFLRDELLDYLKERYGKCYYEAETDYVANIHLDEYAFDDSQQDNTYDNSMKIYDDREIEDLSAGEYDER